MSDQNIIRLLVASDIHLGYGEKDPIKANDTYITFEEILQIAKREQVDFLLLGGDLFHENKPSRPCLNKCITLLKQYCLGDHNNNRNITNSNNSQIDSNSTNNLNSNPPACSSLEYVSNTPQNIVLTDDDLQPTHASKINSSGSTMAKNIKNDISSVSQGEFTRQLLQKRHIDVNYLDPDLNVTLPVFSVHGNHDDPTGKFNLSAIDILAAAGLLNHFGRNFDSNHNNTANNKNNPNTELNIDKNNNENGQKSNLERIYVPPLLFRKGTTNLALYGLGSIRDERLHRLFAYKQVQFLRPKPLVTALNKADDRNGQADEICSQPEDDGYFNLFVIHQNRTKHGATNYIPEHFLDEFIDLIIWGHEHECLIDPQWNSEKSFFVSQPGSSVATSLSPGEAAPKHVGLLQIKNKSFKMTKIPLKTVRPFAIRDVDLSRDAAHLLGAIPPTSKKFSEVVLKYLNETVCDMIENQITALIQDDVRQPHKPLIRIRLEYDDKLEFLNPIKFGQAYVDTVANPKDIIHFYKKKNETEAAKGKGERQALREFLARTCPIDQNQNMNGTGNEGIAIEGSEGLSVQGVEELVANFLQKADTINQLSLLTEKGLGLALRQYIDKQELEAINELVKHQLGRIQDDLMSKDEIPPSEDAIDTEIFKFKEERIVRQITQQELLDRQNISYNQPPTHAATNITNQTAASINNLNSTVVAAKNDRAQNKYNSILQNQEKLTKTTKVNGSNANNKISNNNNMDMELSDNEQADLSDMIEHYSVNYSQQSQTCVVNQNDNANIIPRKTTKQISVEHNDRNRRQESPLLEDPRDRTLKDFDNPFNSRHKSQIAVDNAPITNNKGYDEDFEFERTMPNPETTLNNKNNSNHHKNNKSRTDKFLDGSRIVSDITQHQNISKPGLKNVVHQPSSKTNNFVQLQLSSKITTKTAQAISPAKSSLSLTEQNTSKTMRELKFVEAKTGHKDIYDSGDEIIVESSSQEDIESESFQKPPKKQNPIKVESPPVRRSPRKLRGNNIEAGNVGQYKTKTVRTSNANFSYASSQLGVFAPTKNSKDNNTTTKNASKVAKKKFKC